MSSKYCYIETIKNRDIVKLLVDNGFNINKKYIDSLRPIQRAIRNDNFECVKNLFYCGAKIDMLFYIKIENDYTDDDDDLENDCITMEEVTILYYAVVNNASVDIIQFLIENGGTYSDKDIELMNIYQYKDDDIEKIRNLADSSLEIKEPDY